MTWTLSSFADEAGLDFTTQITASQAAGFTHIDLRRVGEHEITTLPKHDAVEVRQQLDDAGIRVNMFGSPIGKTDISDDPNIDLGRLDHLAELAEPLGCRAVRVFSYFNRKRGWTKDRWRDEALRRLERLTDRARSYELTLYHENEGDIFGDRAGDVLLLAEAMCEGEPGGPNRGTFRTIFDFDNYRRGGDDVWQAWQMLIGHTDAFHLKDSDAQDRHLPAGQGEGRLREVLVDAVKRGWSGPLTVEPHLLHSSCDTVVNPETGRRQPFRDWSKPASYAYASRIARNLLDEVQDPTTPTR